jgi:Fe2+ transport system protein FeoA
VKRHRRGRHHRRGQRHKRHAHRDTLAGACPGVPLKIVDMDGLPGPSRLKLLGLGLWPGRCVEVIRHSPVTLIRAEHSELALEAEMASRIRVESVDPQQSPPDLPCTDSDK